MCSLRFYFPGRSRPYFSRCGLAKNSYDVLFFEIRLLHLLYSQVSRPYGRACYTRFFRAFKWLGFWEDGQHDGRKFRILNIIDEYSRECLASIVARRIRSGDVIQALADLFLKRGVPKHIRSDNGPEFVATKLRWWLKALDVKPLFIFPGSPWENGYCESFNGKMRYEFLNGEIFFSLLEAKVIIEQWRRHYNTKRPHSALGYRPPAPLAFEQDFRRVLAAVKL